MGILEQRLYDYMIDRDVPPLVAQSAAEECARRMERNAVLGAAGGFAVGFLTANPGAILMGLAGAGFGGAATLLASPSCEQVREAASQIISQTAP